MRTRIYIDVTSAQLEKLERHIPAGQRSQILRNVVGSVIDYIDTFERPMLAIAYLINGEFEMVNKSEVPTREEDKDAPKHKSFYNKTK